MMTRLSIVAAVTIAFVLILLAGIHIIRMGLRITELERHQHLHCEVHHEGQMRNRHQVLILRQRMR